jgi:excisionase family DNA binding protein
LTEKLINMDDLSKLLGVSITTISRLRKQGMPALKIGGSIRFDPAKIQAWMETRGEVKEGNVGYPVD